MSVVDGEADVNELPGRTPGEDDWPAGRFVDNIDNDDDDDEMAVAMVVSACVIAAAVAAFMCCRHHAHGYLCGTVQ